MKVAKSMDKVWGVLRTEDTSQVCVELWLHKFAETKREKNLTYFPNEKILEKYRRVNIFLSQSL